MINYSKSILTSAYFHYRLNAMLIYNKLSWLISVNDEMYPSLHMLLLALLDYK